MENRGLGYFASLTVEECCTELETNADTGLDHIEAKNRLLKFGLNNHASEPKESLYDILIDQFSNPLILLLVGSAFLSLIIGEYKDGISIGVTIAIVLTVALVQEYQSSKSMEALYQLAPPKCHVVRGGKSEHIVAMNLVPGDIIRISRGDRVPADCRLIACTSLEVDESSLTGETDRIAKTDQASASPISSDSYTRKQNLIFMGTLVKYGHGVALVIGTGKSTEFGSMMDYMAAVNCTNR